MSFPVFYVEAGDTLPVMFTTYDGGTGASITLTGLLVTDIEIYKDGSITQRSSDAGYALIDTDGIDIDATTGLHGFTIDLSDNTDAGFYAVGSWYHVVVNAVTVDAQTVVFIACAFRIVSATRGLAGTALPDAAADAAGGLPISDAGGLGLDAMNTNINDIKTDTADIQPKLGTVTDLGSGATVAGNLADMAGATFSNTTDSLEAIRNVAPHGTAMRGTDSAALASVATEARLAELDAANLPADIAAVKTDTAATLVDTAEIGAAGAGLTDLGGMSTTMKAQVNTEVDSAFTTQMADSVPADGTIATREQALYMIVQMLTDFSISSVTLTVRKVDGSTPLMTFTLDDPTNPTSLTRAT